MMRFGSIMVGACVSASLVAPPDAAAATAKDEPTTSAAAAGDAAEVTPSQSEEADEATSADVAPISDLAETTAGEVAPGATQPPTAPAEVASPAATTGATAPAPAQPTGVPPATLRWNALPNYRAQMRGPLTPPTRVALEPGREVRLSVGGAVVGYAHPYDAGAGHADARGFLGVALAFGSGVEVGLEFGGGGAAPFDERAASLMISDVLLAGRLRYEIFAHPHARPYATVSGGAVLSRYEATGAGAFEGHAWGALGDAAVGVAVPFALTRVTLALFTDVGATLRTVDSVEVTLERDQPYPDVSIDLGELNRSGLMWRGGLRIGVPFGR